MTSEGMSSPRARVHARGKHGASILRLARGGGRARARVTVGIMPGEQVSLRPLRPGWRYPLSPALEKLLESLDEEVKRLKRDLRCKFSPEGRAKIKEAIAKLRLFQRREIQEHRRAFEASKAAARAEERQRKRQQKPRWQKKREAERDFRRVQLQMMPWTRVGQKYAKHHENQVAHLRRQLPKMRRHVPKRDRPRCGFPCGHPLRPTPCQASVVAGRHPGTGAPILGKHCRKHGGWT